jgi:hypothetical protein
MLMSADADRVLARAHWDEEENWEGDGPTSQSIAEC